jgi:hypothetical protein
MKNQGHPVIDLGLTKRTKQGGQSGCGGVILALLVLGGSLSYLNKDIIMSFGHSGKTNLKFRYACGSPPNSGSTWYSVIGSRQSIDLVKSKYCGDVFMTPSNQLQVASFTSVAEAKEFSAALSTATGHQFWVSR